MGSQRDVSWMGLVDGDAATFFSVFLSVPSLSQSSKCFAVSRVFLRSIPGQHRIRTLLSYCRRLLCDRSAAALVLGCTNFLSTHPTTCQPGGGGRAPPRLKFLSYSIPEPEDIVQILNITSSVKRVFFKFLSVRPNGETKNMKPF